MKRSAIRRRRLLMLNSSRSEGGASPEKNRSYVKKCHLSSHAKKNFEFPRHDTNYRVFNEFAALFPTFIKDPRIAQCRDVYRFQLYEKLQIVEHFFSF